MTIASGTKLGRYDVRSHLGAGAMGEVYLAQDTVLGRVLLTPNHFIQSNIDQFNKQRVKAQTNESAGMNL